MSNDSKKRTDVEPSLKNAKFDRKGKTIMVREKSNQIKDVSVVPSLNGLINDALSIMGSELASYKSKTARGVVLDLKEARVVTNYLDALTRASKESREQARAEDLADLSNEELLQLATQLIENSASPKINDLARSLEKKPNEESGNDDE